MTVRDNAVLAARNLMRHGRRTLITAGAVAFGLVLYIFIDSLLVGAERDSERNLIWYETGIAQVVHEEYVPERQDRPLRYTVDDADRILADFREAGLPTTARTVFSAELVVFQDPYPEDGSTYVTGYGIDPDHDDDVYRLESTVVAGRYLEAGANEAMLASWLAEDLGAEVGFPITMVTRTREGFYQTIDLDIVGIVDTPNPIINRTAVFMPLDMADLYLQMDGEVTEVAVAASELRRVDRVTDTMRAQLGAPGDLTVVDWRVLAADYVALAQAKQGGSGAILMLVFVIAAVGVSNTVLMSILERTRELGMMRALGMRERDVMATILFEAGGIGLIGGLIGVVLGIGATAYMVYVGIDYSQLLRDVDVGYRLTGVFYGAWHPQAFAQALVAGIVICVLTAIVPIRRAMRRPIVDSLRAA